MSFTTLITCFLAMGTTGWAQYVLEDDYMSGGNFFDQFSFFDGPDPTKGFVDYGGAGGANEKNLTSSSSSNVQMRVDSTNKAPNGRSSVRITSNKSYNSGLFIIDADHMPTGCGTWPAFWLVGPNWPSGGEIDIIEGVNEQATNAMTLHTGPGCSITDNNAFSGAIVTDNCDINAAGQDANVGCSIKTESINSYGTGFNDNKGGVYATEWTSSAISIYFFPRGSIPADISSGSPTPSSWGKPLAQFQGGCDIPDFFSDQQIVFDTTFCGDWAGAVWSSGSCAAKADTCNAFVANNPDAFTDAFWSINALKVYQSGGSTSSKVESTTAWGYSSSVSVAEPTSTSVWAASYSSSAIPTTFALSSKPVTPTPPLSLPVTAPYSSGNATDAPYPTGSGSAIVTAPVPSGTGSPPVASPTDISMSSSPPESTSVEAATSSDSPTQTMNWQTRSWSHRHHYTPSPQAVRRHIRQHKRHGAGLL
ncbi:hypothetical protein LTS12_016032 [Elasticomyces elasticus]|nr:hypothetical protein LTS12_016032 [Elasticomyces elasticus]